LACCDGARRGPGCEKPPGAWYEREAGPLPCRQPAATALVPRVRHAGKLLLKQIEETGYFAQPLAADLQLRVRIHAEARLGAA
jgi:hypothetical protein